ncbi:MAG: hypothetical protein IKK29_05675, partial [Christensenellaceae bacterium]|nr:hypothetical protein [Christensenellaceae bacterium]
IYEPSDRIADLYSAKMKGIKTWVSFEPVLDADEVLRCIEETRSFVDKVKIGKLNYYPSDINWKVFGKDVESLCRKLGIDYYIKDSLRAEMEN